MANYWTALFTARTWKEWLAAKRHEAGFPAGARAALSKVRQGDILLCYVGSPQSAFVGAFTVVGDLMEGGSSIWSGDFPLRLPIRVEAARRLDDAVPYMSIPSLPTMASNDGRKVPSRGQAGSTARAVNEANGKEILARLLKPSVQPPTPSVEVPLPTPSVGPTAVSDERTLHESTQLLIAKLGTKLGFRVWIASNDKARVLALPGAPKLDGVLDDLPQISSNQRIQRLIGLIDVLWLRRHDCVAAFEIECTTSVYSGLLRMADLMTLQPNLAIPMYIVAPEARRSKVVSEITRPVFAEGLAKPLNRTCRYMPIEKLGVLDRVPDELWDSMKMSVIETMSELVEPPLDEK